MFTTADGQDCVDYIRQKTTWAALPSVSAWKAMKPLFQRRVSHRTTYAGKTSLSDPILHLFAFSPGSQFAHFCEMHYTAWRNFFEGRADLWKLLCDFDGNDNDSTENAPALSQSQLSEMRRDAFLKCDVVKDILYTRVSRELYIHFYRYKRFLELGKGISYEVAETEIYSFISSHLSPLIMVLQFMPEEWQCDELRLYGVSKAILLNECSLRKACESLHLQGFHNLYNWKARDTATTLIQKCKELYYEQLRQRSITGKYLSPLPMMMWSMSDPEDTPPASPIPTPTPTPTPIPTPTPTPTPIPTPTPTPTKRGRNPPAVSTAPRGKRSREVEDDDSDLPTLSALSTPSVSKRVERPTIVPNPPASDSEVDVSLVSSDDDDHDETDSGSSSDEDDTAAEPVEPTNPPARVSKQSPAIRPPRNSEPTTTQPRPKPKPASVVHAVSKKTSTKATPEVTTKRGTKRNASSAPVSSVKTNLKAETKKSTSKPKPKPKLKPKQKARCRT